MPGSGEGVASSTAYAAASYLSEKQVRVRDMMCLLAIEKCKSSTHSYDFTMNIVRILHSLEDYCLDSRDATFNVAMNPYHFRRSETIILAFHTQLPSGGLFSLRFYLVYVSQIGLLLLK